ncbi:MAG: acyltransferase family protein, partial [Gemmatimonadaceae bacterium]
VSNHRPDVEGLRAVAVLLVVAFHVGIAGVSGGFIGVDVFFVLSGYLITQLLMREYEKSGKIDFVKFYARRSRRLLPAAALMLVATIVASYFLFSPLEQHKFAGTAASTGAYLSNVWFARNATDYLAAGGDTNPLLHTWSLAVEEQFYIFWPTIILLVLRFARGRKAAIVVAMTVIAVLSMAVSLRVTRTAAPWAFFGSPTRAWEFAAGALASLVVLQPNALSRRVASVFCVGGLVAIFAASFVFTRATTFPGTAALLPVLGTAVVLVGAPAYPSHVVLRPLSTAPMQWLGKLSYSWYLWHWPVLVLGAIYAGRTPSISARIALATFALGIAWFTHVVLENPVRYSRWLGMRPIQSLVLAASLTSVSIGAGLAWRRAAAREMRSPAQQAFQQAHDDLPRVYADNCHLTFFETTWPSCAYGDTASATTIVLLGDSHAAEWFPAIEHLARSERWRLISLTKSGCPSASFKPYALALGRPYTECGVWRELALTRILDLRPKFVVMSNASQYVHASDARLRVTSNEWRDAEAETLQRLSAASIPTFVVRDSPIPGFDVPTCASRLTWRTGNSSGQCDASRAIAVEHVAADAEAQAVTRSGTARLLDMTDAICGETVCPAEKDGRVVYRDDHHLTASFVSYLAPLVIERMGIRE